MDKYENEHIKRHQEFEDTIERLTKARDEKGMDPFLTGLAGIMALTKTQQPMEESDGEKAPNN